MVTEQYNFLLKKKHCYFIIIPIKKYKSKKDLHIEVWSSANMHFLVLGIDILLLSNM